MTKHSAIAVFLSTFLAPTAFAAAYVPLDIKPGLWKIESQVTSEGKTFSPDAEMKKAFAKLPPEQRKKMEAMMAQSGGGLGRDGIRHCHSAESLKNPKELLQDREQECSMDVKTSTAKKFAGAFSCKDGSSGDVEVTVKDANRYDGKLNGKAKDGKITRMTYAATFVSADCGNVKAD